jgi:hypothetical protein
MERPAFDDGRWWHPAAFADDDTNYEAAVQLQVRRVYGAIANTPFTLMQPV